VPPTLANITAPRREHQKNPRQSHDLLKLRGIDSWLRGAGTGADLAEVSEAASAWGAGDLMRWLRRRNQRTSRPIRFAGIDLPEAGSALRPALDPAAEYLREVDPESLSFLETALGIADQFTGGPGAAAASAWARLDIAEQDALTAALARRSLRVRALGPCYVSRSNQHRYDVALRRVEAACHTDYMWRASNGLYTGYRAVG
jgi:erythromycin esterase